jgi:hypothetical protein
MLRRFALVGSWFRYFIRSGLRLDLGDLLPTKRDAIERVTEKDLTQPFL